MKTIEPILGGQYFASLLVVGLFDGGQWSSATKEALCSEGRRGEGPELLLKLKQRNSLVDEKYVFGSVC